MLTLTNNLIKYKSLVTGIRDINLKIIYQESHISSECIHLSLIVIGAINHALMIICTITDVLCGDTFVTTVLDYRLDWREKRPFVCFSNGPFCKTHSLCNIENVTAFFSKLLFKFPRAEKNFFAKFWCHERVSPISNAKFIQSWILTYSSIRWKSYLNFIFHLFFLSIILMRKRLCNRNITFVVHW